MMKKLIQKMGLAGVLFCAPGCLTTVDTVENADKAYIPNEMIRLHVETDTSQKIKVTNLLEKTAPNGFMQIAVELTNLSSSPRTVFYRCEWYDESGMRVETSLTHWIEGRFAARDTKQVLFTAPNAIAKDFKIRLSEDPR
jgi:Predicted periplasmic lipoprotein